MSMTLRLLHSLTLNYPDTSRVEIKSNNERVRCYDWRIINLSMVDWLLESKFDGFCDILKTASLKQSMITA